METINFFNSRADKWDDNKKKQDVIRTAIVTLTGIKENHKVLDIACGTGVMTPELLKLNPKEIVGIDISDKMIEIAKSKFVNENRVKFVCEDLLEFKEDNFDVALMYNAYPHFLDKDAMLKKIVKILAPKGRFIIAHGAGKDAINKHHGNVPKNICTELLSAKEEVSRLEGYFEIDIIIDTPYAYMISGIMK